jgi:hypothetical protein
MATIIAISQHLARSWSSLHPIFKEHRRKSFNYPEKFPPDFSNLEATCGRWASPHRHHAPLEQTMENRKGEKKDEAS